MKAITLASHSNPPFAASELRSAFNGRASRHLQNARIKDQNSAQFPRQDSNLPLPM
jgi:hypothetical protein